MTMNEPSWLSVGVRALDTASGGIGVVQLIQDERGAVQTGAIQRPARVLLRSVGLRCEPLWWAAVADLERPPGGGR